MKTQVALGISALMCVASACDGEPLVGPDGGERDVDDGGVVDGGFSDAGFSDAGFFDAGFFDAGYVDAGPEHDAGSPCTFQENPSLPSSCEDDADYCDPIETRFSPEADLLETWSYVDGEEFVMQVRMLAPPFRRIPRLTIRFLVGGPGSGSAIVQSSEPANQLTGLVGYALYQDRLFPAESVYPPAVRVVEYQPGTAAPPFDPCWFSLSLTSGLVELRVPLPTVLDYAFGADGADDSMPVTSDASWSAVPQFLISRGGRADDEDTLVSICELACPFE